LRDKRPRRRFDPPREVLALGRGRSRADQHPVTTRAVRAFDDELIEVVEDVATSHRVGTVERLDVLEQRLFAQVEANHRRNEPVERLVVRDSGADRVGQPDVPGAVGVHESDDPECGVGPEIQRVHEVVVDAPVDHVHAFQAASRLEEDAVVDDQRGHGPRPVGRP